MHDNVAVGEADDETVLGRIVLVLGLGDEALSGVVVGLSDYDGACTWSGSDCGYLDESLREAKKYWNLTCSTRCS